MTDLETLKALCAAALKPGGIVKHEDAWHIVNQMPALIAEVEALRERLANYEGKDD